MLKRKKKHRVQDIFVVLYREVDYEEVVWTGTDSGVAMEMKSKNPRYVLQRWVDGEKKGEISSVKRRIHQYE